MPLSPHDSKVTMYVDDTSLACTSNSINDTRKSMNAELENLRNWLHGINLTLNVVKTTSMIIGSNRTLHQSNSGGAYTGTFQHIRRSNRAENICKVSKNNFDNQIKRKDHINLVSSKVYRAMGVMRYTEKVLPSNLLIIQYLGLVEPHFRYCCSVWGLCGSNCTQKPR